MNQNITQQNLKPDSDINQENTDIPSNNETPKQAKPKNKSIIIPLIIFIILAIIVGIFAKFWFDYQKRVSQCHISKRGSIVP